MNTLDRLAQASDIMALNPISISESASIRTAAAFLLAKRISAAPVINEAGRAVGVITLKLIAQFATPADSACAPDLDWPVREIMDDRALFVKPDTPITCVVERLLRSDEKQVLVADDDGTLVGVVSARDVVRNLEGTEELEASREYCQSA